MDAPIKKYQSSIRKLDGYISAFNKMKYEAKKECMNELGRMFIASIGNAWRNNHQFGIIRPYKAKYESPTDKYCSLLVERFYMTEGHDLRYESNDDVYVPDLQSLETVDMATVISKIDDTFDYLHSSSRDDKACAIKLKNKYVVLSPTKGLTITIEAKRDKKSNQIKSLYVSTIRSYTRDLNRYAQSVKTKWISLDEFDADMQKLYDDFKSVIVNDHTTDAEN